MRCIFMFKTRAALLCIVVVLSVSGCRLMKDEDKKIRDIDFTVADVEDVPEKIKEIINEKKEEKYQVVFSDRENTYIIVGYGKRSGDGYNIKVTELYETETNIMGTLVFEGKEEERQPIVIQNQTVNEMQGEATCYPYIILKIEYTEKPVKIRNGYQNR